MSINFKIDELMEKIYLLVETTIDGSSMDVLRSRRILCPATKSKERMMRMFKDYVSDKKKGFEVNAESFKFEEKDYDEAIGKGIVHTGHFEVKFKNGELFYYNSSIREIDFINE